jgi:activator of Hsp90 ATPase-like protein
MLRLLVNPANNMSKTNLQQQIIVHALPSKVWKVLTGPQYINQYLFDGNINSDWTEGSSILLVEENTKPISIGQVLQSVPGILLQFGFREENTSTYLVTTYELILAGEGVELKMKCEGFNASQQEYLIRVQHSNLLLQKIKWLSEYS